MANDNWRTPPEVYALLNAEFNFQADMAASDINHLHDFYFTEEIDSLSFDWSTLFKDKYVWLNPPYSNPKPWVSYVRQQQELGVGTVMLLNSDMSTAWFDDAFNSVSEIRNIIGGRLAFLDADGNPIKGNNKSQFFLIFHPYDNIKSPTPLTSYIHIDDLMQMGKEIMKL